MKWPASPRTLALAASLLILPMSACRPASPLTIKVFAASSLSGPFEELGASFTRETGVAVQFQFAGSQILSRQLQQGARADAFASASDTEILALTPRPRLVRALARNRLAVIARPGSHIHTLADLAGPGVKLVLPDVSVPSGKYARTLLRQAGASGRYGAHFEQQALANVVSLESNVRQALWKVQLGEADAGIVYQSDLVNQPAGVQVTTVPVPEPWNPVATYWITQPATASSLDAGARFIQYVLSPSGQATMRRWGFQAPAGRTD